LLGIWYRCLIGVVRFDFHHWNKVSISLPGQRQFGDFQRMSIISK
jgi:hypothetical protein